MAGGVTRTTRPRDPLRVAARLYRGVAELAELVRDGGFDDGDELVEELRRAVARVAERAAAAGPPRSTIAFPARRAATDDEELARRLHEWLADERFGVEAAELLEALGDDELPFVESRSAEEAGLDVFTVYGHWLAAWRDGSDPRRWQLVAIGAGGRLDEVGEPGGPR